MICKYCGSRMDGQKCPSCGRESPQVVRSMQLDELMAGPVTKPAASSKPAPAPKASPVPNASAPAAPGPTYDQGVREGYQRGLQEGYENGRREGLAETPAPRKGGVRPAVVALLCAACLAVAALGSGIVMRGIGRNEGAAQEKANNTPLPVPTVSSEQLDAEYNRGLKEGRGEAEDAKQELEAVKKELEKQLEQAREEARNEGILQELVNLDNMDFPYEKKTGKDETVQEIQQMLYNLGCFPKDLSEKDATDGFFGDNTQKAVTKFQLASGLISDDQEKGNLTGSRAGIVDMETYVRLLLAYRGSVSFSPAPTDDLSEETQEPDPEPSPEPTPTPTAKKTQNQTDNNRNIVPTPDPSGSNGSDAGTMPVQPGNEPTEKPTEPAPPTAPPVSSDTDLAQKKYIARIL